MSFVDKDLLSIQEARILVENAREAQKTLRWLSQEWLDRRLEPLFQILEGRLRELAFQMAEETGYGSGQEEYRYLHALISRLAEVLKNRQYVGLPAAASERQVVEIGVPIGVVAVLCSLTNALAASLMATLLALKTGNAVVVAPPTRGGRTVARALALVAESASAVGFPPGSVTCLQTVSQEGVSALTGHPDVGLVVGTGATRFCAWLPASKAIFWGSDGPGLAFVERTADARLAAAAIVLGRSFNGGTLPAAEQHLVVDRLIAAALRNEMRACGAYFLNAEEERRLAAFIGGEGMRDEPSYIGKTASWLAGRAGFTVAERTKILVAEQKYVSAYSVYGRALRCPILVFYLEDDWMRACEKCIELLRDESLGQAMAIHSQSATVIREFALRKPVARILVNTPAAFGAMGLTSALFPAVTLGGVSAGCARNLAPDDFIYRRKLAYGVREADGIPAPARKTPENLTEEDPVDLMRQIIRKMNR